MTRFLRARRSSAFSTLISVAGIKHETGVSILEFAIVAPVLFLLIAGVIDFGLKINTVKQIAAAARHSARIGASHPRRLLQDEGTMAICSSAGKPSAPESLVCPDKQAEPIFVNDTVSRAAFKAACTAIEQSKLAPTDWRVNSSVIARQEDGQVFQLIRVQIQREAPQGVRGKDCFLCFGRLYQLFEDQSESQFVLEEPCA